MDEVHAVLLIPTEGDPYELLRKGPCGARPPTAWVTDPPERVFGSMALVLAWNGEPVPDGLWRVLLKQDTLADVKQVCRSLMAGGPHAKAAHDVWGKLGTLVLLDAEDREVTRG